MEYLFSYFRYSRKDWTGEGIDTGIRFCKATQHRIKIAAPINQGSCIIISGQKGSTFYFATNYFLLVNCFQHGTATSYRWLNESLAFTQLQQYFRFLEFFLVL